MTSSTTDLGRVGESVHLGVRRETAAQWVRWAVGCLLITPVAAGCAMAQEPLDAFGIGRPAVATCFIYVPVLRTWPGQERARPDPVLSFEGFERVQKRDPFFLEFEGKGVWMDTPDSLEGSEGGACLWRLGVGVRLHKRASALLGWGSLREGLHGRTAGLGDFATVSLDLRF